MGQVTLFTISLLQPTRQSALHDLIFVSPHYTSVVVNELSSIGESDHNAQLIYLPFVSTQPNKRFTTKVDYAVLRSLLQHVD